jgi:hypothetical protein
MREWYFLGSGFQQSSSDPGGREWEFGETERKREGRMGGSWERKVSAGSAPQSQSQHQNVRKNATHKESSQEKSHVQEQSLMAGLSCQAAQGKMAQHRLWARRGFYRRGSLRKLVHAQKSLVGVELLLGMAPFLK